MTHQQKNMKEIGCLYSNASYSEHKDIEDIISNMLALSKFSEVYACTNSLSVSNIFPHGAYHERSCMGLDWADDLFITPSVFKLVYLRLIVPLSLTS